MNILIKNVLDACVGCMAFYFFGWGVAYGVDDDGEASSFIGAGSFFLAKNKANGGFSDWKVHLPGPSPPRGVVDLGLPTRTTQFAASPGLTPSCSPRSSTPSSCTGCGRQRYFDVIRLGRSSNDLRV